MKTWNFECNETCGCESLAQAILRHPSLNIGVAAGPKLFASKDEAKPVFRLSQTSDAYVKGLSSPFWER